MTTGFLPYSSDPATESSIVLKDPLTSLPDWTVDSGPFIAAPFASSDSGTAIEGDFDSTGFAPNGRYLRFITLATMGGTLDEGQVSFDVEKEWLCVDDADNGSFGASGGLPGSRCFVELQSLTGDDLQFFRSPGALGAAWARTGADPIQVNAISGDVNEPLITTVGKGDYVRIGIGWVTNGLNMDYYFSVDNAVLCTFSYVKAGRAQAYTKEIEIGAAATGSIVGNYRIKNLLVSTEGPVFTTGRKIMLFGDSQARRMSLISSADGVYDSGQAWTMLRELAAQGEFLDSGQVIDTEDTANIGANPTRYGGYSIAESATSSLYDEILPTLTAHNPTDVVLIMGTNDSIGTVEADFQASLDFIIDTVRDFPSVDRYCVVGVRSFIAGVNSIPNENLLSNQENRDDIVNPALAASVPAANYVETFTLLGGDTPASYTFVGQNTGSLNDIHIAGTATLAEGPLYVTALVIISAGSSTLTLPYPIGTNNGPLFTIDTSDTLATIEAAGFFTGNAGYASLLKTGDVVIIKASNGTKMYTVTVDQEQRTITLSTGLAIA